MKVKNKFWPLKNTESVEEKAIKSKPYCALLQHLVEIVIEREMVIPSIRIFIVAFSSSCLTKLIDRR